ncbi:Actin cross-linking toxin VgrG1 [Fundidesulfovibrio magnetotacticus]|uniref:Actin cross-linking toxin VgrG1 n=1 Tax=Fundidesulfovibrio magnetotacticus TaxID=2730080 RepID=A0A6V8LL94_9BACT|nr:type VI secretion system tip protein TssI/VgrG [Fundidesulfovibrio magnetotacticus]GFK93453.1 Actin cross-linking toxin VgrG1 [Fundidesulfovibrio magnetotacticus]
MAQSRYARFEFDVEGQPAGRFQVVEFQGQDALSTPYAFTITLICQGQGPSPAEVVRRKATLRINGETTSNAYSGVVFAYQYIQSRGDVSFFRAVLSPGFKLLTYTRQNQIFLDQSLPQILSTVFGQCRFTAFDLRLSADYPPLEFVCQYNESCLDFVSRLMEHQGIYYAFEEQEAGEVLVVTDSLMSHTPLSATPCLYLPPSGMDDPQRESAVHQLVLDHRIVPAVVVLKDYNYLRPDLELLAEAPVAPDGVGVHYHYGDHFLTQDEGARLARIRAEELLAGQEVFAGASTAMLLRAGGLVTLAGHPLEACNIQMLVTGVEHKGRDKTPLTAGLEHAATASDQENYYRNTFHSMASRRQFRPARSTPRPRIAGQFHAKVDAEGEGQYAMIDDLGRYKVRLPFDLAGRPEGQASCWLRLAEPYAGPRYGLHFPLLKGTEVLLSFIDGDPDRPVITSAVHNGQNLNHVRSNTNAINAIKSAANNQIVMGDLQGQEFIGLYSPFHETSIALGSTKPGGGGSMEFKTKGESQTLVLGDENKLVGGTSIEGTAGVKAEITAGMALEIMGGWKSELVMGNHFGMVVGNGLEMGSESKSIFDTKEIQGTTGIEIQAGLSEAYVAALTSMRNWYTAAAGLTAVAAVLGTAASETWTKDGCWHDQGDSAIDEGLGITFTGLTGVVGIIAGYCGYKIQQQLNAIQTGSLCKAVTEVAMNKDGFEVEVNRFNLGALSLSNVSPLPTPITLKAVGQNAAKQTVESFLQFRQDAAGIRLVNMEPSTGGPEPSMLVMSNANLVSLLIPDAGQLKMDATAQGAPVVTLQAIEGQEKSTVQLDKHKVLLQAPDGSATVEVQKNLVALASAQAKTTGVNINASDVLLNATGKVDIMGGLVKVQGGKVYLGGAGGASITGDLTVDGATTLKATKTGDLSVNGNVNITGSMSAQSVAADSASVKNDLSVGGKTTTKSADVKDDLNVGGKSTSGSANVKGDLKVGGKADVDGNVSSGHRISGRDNELDDDPFFNMFKNPNK